MDDAFDARFDCLEREYVYYFYRGNMDIPRMRGALHKMVGTHDFRNFGRVKEMDSDNYVRTVSAARIEEVSGEVCSL